MGGVGSAGGGGGGGGVRKFIRLTRGGGQNQVTCWNFLGPRVLYVGNPLGIYTVLHILKYSFTFVIVRIMFKNTFWMSVIYILVY